MATIAIPHIGFVSHLGAPNRLGGVLARHGHRVLAWAPEAFRDRIVATGAEFRRHEAFALRDQLWSPQALTAALAEHTLEFAGELIHSLDGEDVDLVVHDYQVAWARVAGEFLGLPRIVSNPVFPRAELHLAPFDPLAPRLAAVPEVAAGIEAAIARVERARGLIGRRWGIDIGGWREALTNPAAVSVSYSTQEITDVAPGEGLHYVGPLLEPVQIASGADETADHDRPFVYASLGTVFNFARRPFEMIVEALAGLPVSALVTTGGGPVRAAELGPAPANVTLVDYVDEPGPVQARADVFLTHAGTSVHEAFLAGSPMVCLPQGGDQELWAGRVVALGAGVLAEPRPAAIRDAVATVLEDPRYRTRAEALGAHLAAYDGEARVVALVEGLLDTALGDRFGPA